MKCNLVVGLCIAWTMAAATAAEPLCPDPQSNAADMECMFAEVEKADAKLAEYLKAARDRIVQSAIPGFNPDATQAAWLRYRIAHCGDVYAYWHLGTYRHRAASQCQVDLTRARTRDIWSAYLTFVDSTPPLRPEP